MGREPPEAAVSGTGGFLGRWSRLKREAQADDPAPGASPPAAPPPAAPEPAAPGPASAEPAAAEAPPDLADLPPVESLTPDSDLAPFLRPGVPAALKNAALRRMWLLDPAIAGHRDVALDYAWDFNAPAAVPGFGGAITPESVQALLDSLSRPAGPEPARAAAPAADVDDPAPPAPADPPQAASPREPPPPAAADPAPQAPSARPRRHGGAMPA